MRRVKITSLGALAKITGDKNVEIEATTLKEVINALTAKYGEEFEDRIYEKEGKLRRFINVYINGRDIRFLNYLDTKLKEGDKNLHHFCCRRRINKEIFYFSSSPHL